MGFACLLIAAACFAQSQPAATRPAAPTTGEIEKAIALGADYLAGVCKADGRFVYRINLDPNVTVQPKYNVLRHAGAMYAMAMRHQWRANKATKDALIRAGEFLRKRCVGPVEGKPDMLAVWSRPEMTGSRNPLTVKLGGVGLGLVALLSLEKVAPGQTPLADLRKLGRFVLFMQREDGSFHSKFIPSTGGLDATWISLYYPGEAALGLLMLYERDPRKEWLQAAANAIGYLARSRKGRPRVPGDHWAMLATAKLLPLYEKVKPPVPREQIVAHAVQVCQSLIAGQITDASDPRVFGCIDKRGRTTPTATRLEGLLAALTFLPAEQAPLRRRISTAAEMGIVFLLRSQVKSGDRAGAIPRATVPMAGTSQTAKRFNHRRGEVRIDYVQHAISAMIQYLDMAQRDRGR